MPVQIAGTSANAEVETASKALRITPKPIDYGSLGIYSLAHVSGLMAAALAANSPIVAWRWGDATRLAVLKKILFSAGVTTGFAAGPATFSLFFARSYTVNDTGGTAETLTGNNAKLRTSMGTTLLTDMRGSATATLTAGTRTKDNQPISSITVTAPGAGITLVPPTLLFEAKAGDYPMVFAQNEGFVIEASVPGTGTWTFAAAVQWEELTAYVP